MTKKLEELFNLEETTPKVEEAPTPTVELPKHEEVKTLDDSYRAVAEITRGLPQIKELDELTQLDLTRNKKKRRFKLVKTRVKRMSNSCQTQIKLVKNATQNYALKRDLII
jgi:hypothetical protein